MKHVLFIVLVLLSCKNGKVVAPKVVVRDTTVIQDISWLKDGEWVLHTWIRTGNHQSITREQDKGTITFGGEQWAEYSVFDTGSAKYLSQIKLSRFANASDYFSPIIVKQKLIQDTLKILNSIK